MAVDLSGKQFRAGKKERAPQMERSHCDPGIGLWLPDVTSTNPDLLVRLQP